MTIHELRPQPKTVTGAIGKHRYTISFDPDQRNWKWSVVVVREYSFTGESPTRDKAQSAVEKQIKRMEENGG